MKQLLDLLKRSFALWVQMRWLKEVEKANKRANRAYHKYKRHNYVAQVMFAEYIRRYPKMEIVNKSEDTK